MFSPQHSVQSPAVGTDTRVHMLPHVFTQLVQDGRPGDPCQTLTSAYGGGLHNEKDRCFLKRVRTKDRQQEEEGDTRAAMS